MRKLLLLSFLLAGGCLWAQTNPPPVIAHPTEINSDSADFELKDRRATYLGHVQVIDPKVRLTCELLVLDLPENGGRLSHVLAQTNVVVDFTDQGAKYHITSDQAVYHYQVVDMVTNETVTFTGHPVASTAQGIIYAEPMIWNRADGRLHFTNPRMISNQNLNTSGAGLTVPTGGK
jgi:lipopolysaccharide export system protein LptA